MRADVALQPAGLLAAQLSSRTHEFAQRAAVVVFALLKVAGTAREARQQLANL
jgi:hypothetical protein